MSNIRANYDKYHDRGFDVVGISTDDDRDALISFLKSNELPWTVLVDEDLKKADRETMSQRYGIFGIPNVTLVGKDGKVAAMDVRGPELGARLEELLGKADAPVAPAEAAKEPAAKEPAAKEPAAKEPAAKEPAAKEPAAKEPDEPKPEGS
jgi:alkyl hydroperoxide reductase subunit AhpC